jgi:hypothetical protein
MHITVVTVKEINRTFARATVVIIKQYNVAAFTRFIIATTIQPHIAGCFIRVNYL